MPSLNLNTKIVGKIAARTAPRDPRFPSLSRVSYFLICSHELEASLDQSGKPPSFEEEEFQKSA